MYNDIVMAMAFLRQLPRIHRCSCLWGRLDRVSLVKIASNNGLNDLNPNCLFEMKFYMFLKSTRLKFTLVHQAVLKCTNILAQKKKRHFVKKNYGSSLDV